MATMHPSSLPDEVRDDPRRSAEIRTFHALDTLDDDFHVFYGVTWQSRSGGRARDGEADFLVAHPDLGLLVLEVKGGGIARGPQGWTSTDRTGTAYGIRDPGQQARENHYLLLDKIHEFPGWSHRHVRAGHGVVFPDCCIDGALALDLPREILMGHDDLVRMRKRIPEMFRHYGAIPGAAQGLGSDGLDLLIDTLARTFTLRCPLGAALVEEERRILTLTQQQVDVLDMLSRLPRVMVRGAAGTGKTILAVEKARRLGKQGFRVLLTCFNRPLAAFLSSSLAGVPGVTVATFNTLCHDLAKEAGLPILENVQGQTELARYFRDEHPRFLLDALDRMPDRRFDAIVVDEAQDFHQHWWEPLLGRCLGRRSLRGGRHGGHRPEKCKCCCGLSTMHDTSRDLQERPDTIRVAKGIKAALHRQKFVFLVSTGVDRQNMQVNTPVSSEYSEFAKDESLLPTSHVNRPLCLLLRLLMRYGEYLVPVTVHLDVQSDGGTWRHQYGARSQTKILVRRAVANACSRWGRNNPDCHGPLGCQQWLLAAAGGCVRFHVCLGAIQPGHKRCSRQPVPGHVENRQNCHQCQGATLEKTNQPPVGTSFDYSRLGCRNTPSLGGQDRRRTHLAERLVSGVAHLFRKRVACVRRSRARAGGDLSDERHHGIECDSKFLGTGIARSRITGNGLAQEGRQFRRQVEAVRLGHRVVCRVQFHGVRLLGRVANERLATCHQAEQQHTQRVQISPWADVLARDLFGGHVCRRTDHQAGFTALFHEFCQPEIQHLHEQLVARDLLHHDVLGLDVPVDDVAGMSGVQRVQDLSQDLRYYLWIDRISSQRTGLHFSAQRAVSLDVFHHQVREALENPVLQKTNDIGMVECGQCRGLALETPAQCVGQFGIGLGAVHDLQGGLHQDWQLQRQVDLAEAAGTKNVNKEVFTDALAQSGVDAGSRQFAQLLECFLWNEVVAAHPARFLAAGLADGSFGMA